LNLLFLTVRTDTVSPKTSVSEVKKMEEFQLKSFNDLTKKERAAEMEGWLKDHDMTWADIDKFHEEEEKCIDQK